MFRRLFAEARGFGLTAFLSALFVAMEAICEVFIPFLMMDIIDIGIASGDMAYILRRGGAMVGMALAALAAGVASGRAAAIASTGFARNLRRRLFNALQDYSFANIDKFSTASLITRLTVDVNNTQMAFMMVIRVLVRAPVMLTFATVMAFRVNAELALIFPVAIPLLALVLVLVARAAYPRFNAMLDKYDKMNAAVQEKLSAIRVIKSFVREDHEREDFRQAAGQLRVYQMRAEKTVILTMPAMMFTMYACMIAVIWFGGNQIIAGSMLAGELFSFMTYIGQILMSLMMMSMVFISLVLSRASMRRILECLDERPDIQDPPDADNPLPLDGSVEFRNVDFSYHQDPGNLHLRGIDLRVEPGETVGIIGGTGSAKTTLVQLIPRLYDATAGQVLVGGHDVRAYKLADLRAAVAMVLQNNLLFSGTIEDNLRWGDAEASPAEIEAAARAAQAHEFIESFPAGYQTVLGQGGVNVSGGQKQRLTIARALLRKPKILILDDSMSAVDTATDAQLRAALRRELKGITVFIIAQRITSVMDADKIIVMDQGQIVACGNHAGLLADSDIYREVYLSQQKGVA